MVRCFRWQTVLEQPGLAARSEAQPPRLVELSSENLLVVQNLKVYFSQDAGFLRFARKPSLKVVDDVSFSLPQQRTLGIVGESGCGKSTIAGALAGLKPVTSGEIQFAGSNYTYVIERRNREALRGLQMVFQNPDSSLNPRHTVEEVLRRPLRCFKIVAREKERDHIISLLNAVQLDESYLERRSSQLSGGEKQRVSIARAFAGGPQLVLCDEPISSLDVSVQAAVLNLLQKLQREHNVALLFISHDLNIVRYLSDEVAVVYLGKVCEIGPTEAIFNPPYHPYTEALVSAIPVINSKGEMKAIRLEGSVPGPANPPSGCLFHTRCPRKVGTICETQEPPAQNGGDGHTIYCHIPLEELREMQTVKAVVVQ
ncbi:ABC transporter ATP-binding protein [Candidatus Flexifilum breve]|uniref:ABC transporter ATP-binding protein n=1 Tax=Candidatus Flexifilum breve TaxID=3140694 RepID=UPI0031CC7536